MAMQSLVLPAFAQDQPQATQPNQAQSADPIVQAQWSALVDAASNAQKSQGANQSYDSSLLPPSPRSGGVDIIDESMKYHNSGMQPTGTSPSSQMGPRNNFNTYGMQNGMANGGMNAMGGMNGMNATNGMNAMGGMNNGMSNNFVMPAAGNPMQNQMLQNQMLQNQMLQNQMLQNQNQMLQNQLMQNQMIMNSGINNNMSNNGSGDGLNTQAIGALGAATMLGVFMQKGGVGGMLQDMGWDGSRHIRGSSIGGY